MIKNLFLTLSLTTACFAADGDLTGDLYRITYRSMGSKNVYRDMQEQEDFSVEQQELKAKEKGILSLACLSSASPLSFLPSLPCLSLLPALLPLPRVSSLPPLVHVPHKSRSSERYEEKKVAIDRRLARLNEKKMN